MDYYLFLQNQIIWQKYANNFKNILDKSQKISKLIKIILIISVY